MKARPLWKFSVTADPQIEDAIAQALECTFGCPSVSYSDFESGETTVSVYLDRKPGLSRRKIEEVLKSLKCADSVSEKPKLSLRPLPPRNWAESWKRHFKPLGIGSTLLIKPSWSRRRPRKGQAVVILDPGLSFGTGQHPTTCFCLKQLAARRNPNQPQSCLDIGTGSGILAIAAARLGYLPVHAFDADGEAINIARANARKNRVLQKIQFFRQDLAKLRNRQTENYSVVCANLISNLLLAERNRIIAQVRPGGILVLAGILTCEFSGIRDAYEAAGMKLLTGRTEKEWRSGAFRRSL